MEMESYDVQNLMFFYLIRADAYYRGSGSRENREPDMG